MEQFGEIGQRVQMLLELALRHEKQHHQIDRFFRISSLAQSAAVAHDDLKAANA